MRTRILGEGGAKLPKLLYSGRRLQKHPTSSEKGNGEFAEQGTAHLSRKVVNGGAGETNGAAAMAAISAGPVKKRCRNGLFIVRSVTGRPHTRRYRTRV